MTNYLSRDDFLNLVRLGPLVSVDLVVADGAGAILLGRRRNEPARGDWFVPGGRILKGETIEAAVARVRAAELGAAGSFGAARLIGAYTHMYDANFAEAPGVTTHYVVLAHAIPASGLDLARLPTDQHDAWRWLAAPGDLGPGEGRVHPHTLPYFAARRGA